MVEVARFFDSASYSEGDQAEVQARFRSNGVLIEVGNKLAVDAPGSMFVSVNDGQAMVEGFWYKNTAPLQLAIANNGSGSTRYDTIIIRLNRTANTMSAAVVQGTPGSGPPTLTQVAGGTWEMPIAVLTVPTGTAAITRAMIADYREYSYPNQVISRSNRLDNPTFRVTQRGPIQALASGQHVVDRWICGIPATSSYLFGSIDAVPPSTGYIVGTESTRAVYAHRTTGTVTVATDLLNVQQNMGSRQMLPLIGQPICVSWWSLATHRTGTYGFNLENPNNNYRYLSSWTHSIPGGWQFNYVVVPWNDSAGFDPTLATVTMVARWVLEAGTNARHTVTNQWINVASKYAPPDMNTSLLDAGNQVWISRPKIEAGTYPTRFESPDPISELVASMRCYQTSYPTGVTVPSANLGAFHHIGAGSIAHGLYMHTVRFVVPMRATPTVTVYPYTTPTNTNRVSNDTGVDFGANSGVPAAAYPTHFSIVNLSGVTLVTGQFGVHFGWQAVADL